MTTHAPLQFFLAEDARAKGAKFAAPRVGDAGFDLPAADAMSLKPGQSALIPTGVHVAIPLGWVGLVRDRSSMAVKGCNCRAGVIDASYRGEIKVLIQNVSTETISFTPGDRIAQLVVVPHMTGEGLIEADSLEYLGETDRGAAGFGSSGK